MNAADDYQFETSRRDLAAGILKQAELDLRRFNGATSAVEAEIDRLALESLAAIDELRLQNDAADGLRDLAVRVAWRDH